MKLNLNIYSSSYLIPKNAGWEKLSEKFKIKFSNLSQFEKTQSKEANISLILFFVSDLIDQYSESSNKKNLKDISNALIKLIKFKTESIAAPVIVMGSFAEKENIIETVNKSTKSEIFRNYFLNQIQKIQKKLSNLYFLNLDNAFNNNKYNEIFDNRNWYLANCRLSVLGIEKVAKYANEIIQRIYNPPKKLLVLDCDNTLWGGIIGEDGLNSILIGQDGIGKAFQDFQKIIKSLSKKGILIAVNSKNNFKDVIEAFKHQGMVLKKNDIVSFKVNWEEKSENIKLIAKELNIGLDSIVFWDDNPLERDKVKSLLPQVLTIEPAKEVIEWPHQLKSLNIFSKFKTTLEDKKKLTQYKARDKFLRKSETFKDQNIYLKSIKLKAKQVSISKSTINRALQMIQKTNQMNLRSVRYSQKELEKLNTRKNISFLVDLKDIYGDHGLVGLLIAKKLTNDTIFLDTFLISCRVFGRNLESWMFLKLKKLSASKGYKNIYAEYIPSKKNIVSKKILTEHKFKKIGPKKLPNVKLKGDLYFTKINKINNKIAEIYVR